MLNEECKSRSIAETGRALLGFFPIALVDLSDFVGLGVLECGGEDLDADFGGEVEVDGGRQVGGGEYPGSDSDTDSASGRRGSGI